MPIDTWMDQENMLSYTYRHDGILFILKNKKKILPCVIIWTHLETIILNEMKKNSRWSHLYIEAKTCWIPRKRVKWCLPGPWRGGGEVRLTKDRKFRWLAWISCECLYNIMTDFNDGSEYIKNWFEESRFIKRVNCEESIF